MKIIVLVLELSLEAHMGVEGAQWPLGSVSKLTTDNRTKLLERSFTTHDLTQSRVRSSWSISLAFHRIQRGRE